MRALPVITLSLSPLGLLVAHALNQATDVTATSHPAPAAPQVNPDAKTQTPAVQPSVAATPEASKLPEFSADRTPNTPPLQTGQIDWSLPITPIKLLPVPQSASQPSSSVKFGLPAPVVSAKQLPVSVPEISPNLLNRVVVRSLAALPNLASNPDRVASPSVNPVSARSTPSDPQPQPTPQANRFEPDASTTSQSVTTTQSATASQPVAIAQASGIADKAASDRIPPPPAFTPVSRTSTATGQTSRSQTVATPVQYSQTQVAAIAPPSNLEIAAATFSSRSRTSTAIAQVPASIAPAAPQPIYPVRGNLPTSQPSFTAPSPAISPASAAGINEAYVLGPGDVIQLNFFNVPEYNGPQQILVDGTVNLPLVGKLSLAGKTLKQAEEAISARYASELQHPVVTVSLTQARSLQVAVAGEITQPGLYALSANQGGQFPTIVQAIQTAGGVTQAADLRRVEVRRRDQAGATRTMTVNLMELIQNGNIDQNAVLRDGDTILIPATAEVDLADANQLAVSNLRNNTNQPLDVALVGEISRPGPYRLDSAAGQPTLIRAVQQAGGITPSADLSKIQVRRKTRQGTDQVININLWKLLQTGDLNQDLVLQQGDTVSIPTAEALTPEQVASLTASSLAPGTIQINIVGEVKSPGRVEVQSNTTLNQAVLAAGGFNGRAEGTVKLIRFNPNGTVTRQNVHLNLSQGLDAQANPILRNNDVLVVGRSTGATITDTLTDVINVIQLLNPFRALF
jgi:protein involved in polysaccharide export with SLBB domain